MPRRKFQPTDEQRQRVRALARYGLKHKQIAAFLDLASTTTLRKSYACQVPQIRMGDTEPLKPGGGPGRGRQLSALPWSAL
jgi:hypothetical protein